MPNHARRLVSLLAATALMPACALAQDMRPPLQSDSTPQGANAGAEPAPSRAGAPHGRAARTAQPGKSGPAIEEVVVTAQKRKQSIVNVPISVVAISGKKLAEQGVAGVAALSQVVPALHIDEAGAFLQPSVRGVSTAVAGLGAEPNVAIYVDGVYRPNALANDFNFIDVSSVQVLKGPQGTLFGRNSTGGAILVTTQTPSSKPTFQATIGYGSFNTVNGSLYASGAVSDKLALSLAVGGENSDGFRKNVLTNSNADPVHDVQGRFKAYLTPNDQLKFTLSVDAFRIDDPDAYAVSAYKGESNAVLFGTDPRLSVGDPTKVSLTPGYAHIASGDGVALKSEYDMDWATLTSWTAGRWDAGYENTNELAAPFPIDGSLPRSPLLQTSIVNADWNYYENTYSEEVNLSSQNSGPWQWTAGVFGFYDNTIYNTFNVGLYGPFGPGGVLSGGTPNPVTFLFPASAYVVLPEQKLFKSGTVSKSIAEFGDLTYNWGKWFFTLGGRYAIDNAQVAYTSVPSVADGFLSDHLTNSHDFYAFTPRAVIRYAFDPRTSVYVSYSEGTKSGIFNGSGYLTQRTPVGQERIRDEEVGFKAELPGLRFEASGFHYNYENLQVATYIGGAAFFQNAPSAELYGGDAHITKTVTDDITLDIGAAYTHSEYTDFPTAAYQYFSPIYGEVNSTKNVTGYTLQRAPRFTGYISFDYKHELFNGLFAFNATGSYQTASYFDFANTLKQNPHGILNLRADWTDPSNHWTVSLIGENVTDTTYLTQVLPNAGGFGAVYGRPASITGQISYKY